MESTSSSTRTKPKFSQYTMEVKKREEKNDKSVNLLRLIKEKMA
jgi:hypothetical protein